MELGFSSRTPDYPDRYPDLPDSFEIAESQYLGSESEYEFILESDWFDLRFSTHSDAVSFSSRVGGEICSRIIYSTGGFDQLVSSWLETAFELSTYDVFAADGGLYGRTEDEVRKLSIPSHSKAKLEIPEDTPDHTEYTFHTTPDFGDLLLQTSGTYTVYVFEEGVIRVSNNTNTAWPICDTSEAIEYIINSFDLERLSIDYADESINTSKLVTEKI